jgi:hypothetical protein
LPFILVADAVVNSDDRAMPEIASDRITASGFMADLLSEAIHFAAQRKNGLLRRFAPRNDGLQFNRLWLFEN